MCWLNDTAGKNPCFRKDAVIQASDESEKQMKIWWWLVISKSNYIVPLLHKD